MPEGDILERGLGVAAQDPGQPGHLLGLDRDALVPHRARTLLAGADRLPHVVGSAWIPWVRPTHSVCACSRARVANDCTSRRVSGNTTSATRWSCSASPVSRTSLEVRP